MASKPLDAYGDLSVACAALASRDKTLCYAYKAIGAPHVRRRSDGFPALFLIIVEQQVSVPSAQAIWRRCEAGIRPLTAATTLRLGEKKIRSFGLTAAKARYVVGLAQTVESGALALDKVATLSDEKALADLQTIKGVGPWTASIYLLFCKGRLDIWPPGDVALLGAYKAAREAMRLSGPKPNQIHLDQRAQGWSPYRGVAAHILWTFYAHIRGREPI